MSNEYDLLKKLSREHEAAIQKELARRIEAQKQAKGPVPNDELPPKKSYLDLKAEVAVREAEMMQLRRALGECQMSEAMAYSERQKEQSGPIAIASSELLDAMREAGEQSGYAQRQIQEREERLAPTLATYQEHLREIAALNQTERAEESARSKTFIRACMVCKLCVMSAILAGGFRADSLSIVAAGGIGVGSALMLVICFWREP